MTVREAKRFLLSISDKIADQNSIRADRKFAQLLTDVVKSGTIEVGGGKRKEYHNDWKCRPAVIERIKKAYPYYWRAYKKGGE